MSSLWPFSRKCRWWEGRDTLWERGDISFRKVLFCVLNISSNATSLKHLIHKTYKTFYRLNITRNFFLVFKQNLKAPSRQKKRMKETSSLVARCFHFFFLWVWAIFSSWYSKKKSWWKDLLVHSFCLFFVLLQFVDVSRWVQFIRWLRAYHWNCT